MYWHRSPYREAAGVVAAQDRIANLTEDELLEARALYDEGKAIEAWLTAERVWYFEVRRWLSAEKSWNAEQAKNALRLDDPAYAAGKLGWEAVRRFVPTLDGVKSWADLAPALQFRYAAFAAAVNNFPVPDEVRSLKQERSE